MFEFLCVRAAGACAQVWACGPQVDRVHGGSGGVGRSRDDVVDVQIQCGALGLPSESGSRHRAASCSWTPSGTD
ncbi:hypothetical protein CEXT_511641, partial [Caerostris extrusa]